GSALMRTYHEDGTEASTIHSSPGLTLMRTYHTDGSGAGEVQVFGASCLMRATTPGGGRGYIRVDGTSASQAVKDDNGAFLASIYADARETYLHSAAGGARRYLSVDADGIWVKTNKSGSWKHYNLEETAQDSGWVNLSYASGFGSAGSGGPFQIRRAGGIVHLRGRLARTSGTIVAGKQYTIGTLNSSWRPAYTQRTLIAGGSSSQWGRIEVSAITGEISIAAISGN